MKRIQIECYVLSCMSVTRDTAHFERSLLNTDAPANAVQIIRTRTIIQKEKKRQEQKYQRRRKLEMILAIDCFVII